MGTIVPEETAAVRPKLLDRHLGGRRTVGNHLLHAVHASHGRGAVKGLHHPLGYQQERNDDGNGNKEIQGAPRQVRPEIAQGGSTFPLQAADQGGHDGNPRGGADEVLHAQPGHLHKVADALRPFAGVELPIRIGHEADCRIESNVPPHVFRTGGIQRQPFLTQQGKEQNEKSGGIE